MKQVGKVFLVGAGPGDPDLITVGAVNALRQADVVLYDRLVNPLFLTYAPLHAVCEYHGRKPGDEGGGRQLNIHERLIEEAKLGKTVVRLKGGDPFVFGRGGEEALALAEAGVPYQVISGVSSSISVPAAAGIPVTHRGLSTAFAVFTGHEKELGGLDENHWKAAAAISTAVFLMGVERLPTIVSKLVQFGKAEDTPIAIVSRGTLPTQEVVVATLADIVSKSVGVESPSVIVVGDCVRVRTELLSYAQALQEVPA